MFAVICKKDSKTSITSLKLTLDEARASMKREILFAYGSYTTFDIIEKSDITEIRKNISRTVADPGWFSTGTKQEIKNELYAEYSICEMLNDAILSFDIEYQNYKKSNDALLEIIKFHADEKKYVTYSDALMSSLTVSAIDYLASYLSKLTRHDTDKLLKWCGEHNERGDILNLIGHINWRINKNIEEAQKYFVMAAQKDNIIALLTLEIYFPGLLSYNAKESLEKIFATETKNTGTHTDECIYYHADRLDNGKRIEFLAWCDQRKDREDICNIARYVFGTSKGVNFREELFGKFNDLFVKCGFVAIR